MEEDDPWRRISSVDYGEGRFCTTGRTGGKFVHGTPSFDYREGDGLQRSYAGRTPPLSRLCMVLLNRRCFIITYITVHHICDNCKKAGKRSMQGRVCGPMRASAPTISRYI